MTNRWIAAVLCSGLLALFFAGCPPEILGAILRTSSASHDFGLDGEVWSFDAWNENSDRGSLVFEVTASVRWIEVAPLFGVSDGPDDRTSINVYLRRDLMPEGVQTASVILLWNGNTLSVDISAENSQGGEGEGEGEGDPPDCEGTPEIIAFEQQVFALINAERVEEDIAPLTHDALLSEVARCHSEDMLARGFFSHTNPDGEDPFDRLANAGVTYRIAGENVAMLSNYPNPAEGVVEGWMDSAGHRENILRESFTHSGLGVAREGETYYFTQVFIGTGKAGKSALYLSEPLVLTAP